MQIETPEKDLPPGVLEERITGMYASDGTPTNDEDRADTIEVSRVYLDGSNEHILIHRARP